MTHNSNVLTTILSKCQEAKALGHSILLVFDLDSTVFDVSPRNQHILREFAKLPETKRKYPSLTSTIESIEIDRYLWGTKEALDKINITSPASLIEEAYQYWTQCFFHNDYLVHDTPVEGAIDYIQTLAKYADIFYLTGRDIHRLGQGTIEQLQRHNLPLKENQSNLILKPHKSMADAEFKLNFLKEKLNSKQHQEIWFFDNDPRNLNLVAEKAMEINQVFFKSAHPPGVSPPKDLPQILHFQTTKK